MSEPTQDVQPSADPAPSTPPEASTSTPPAATPDPATPPPADEPPAYTPNFKYKVLGEERELPENFRGYIKKEEEEKAFRDLFERADAMDHHKTKHTEMKDYLNKLYPEYQRYHESITEIGELYNKGDMDLMFEKLGVDAERVYNWALKKAQYAQLPDDQKRVYDEKRRAETEAYSSQRALEAVRREREMFENSVIKNEYRSATSRPEVVDYIKWYDSLNGQGAFLEHVCYIGDQQTRRTGTRPMAEEVVNQIMSRYKIPGNGLGEPSQAPTGTPVVTAPPKTIPNVNSRSGSHIKPVVKSVEDIERLRKEKFGH